MSSINFDNAYLLLIAIPLVALLAVPFFIAVKKDNRNGHNIASMVLHVLMAVIIAFAAAGTEIVTVITRTSVYVVADVSYSAEKNLDTIDGYIEDLRKNLPRNSKLGVICFGKDVKLTTPLGKKPTPVRDSGVDDTESNISQALEYAGSLFEDDVIKRIVVITDGVQTYTDDPSDLTRTVASLTAHDIKVDAIYLNDNIGEDEKEVQISGAEYTSGAYLGHSETVRLSVHSSYVANAIVTLYKDGEEYRKTPVNLSLGANAVTFTLDTSAAGDFEYRAEITVSADGDKCAFNNSYTFKQKVTEVVNVLLFTGNEGDSEKLSGIYPENTEITEYNINKNAEVPVSVEDLCKYDEIVLSDADLTKVNNYEMLLSSINTAVSMFGKGLVTFGNTSIQNKTEGELKQLDDMLPVRFGEVTGNPKLYTCVIDVSHSMSLWSRMIIARQAATQIVNALKDEDYVSIVVFSGDSKVELTPTKLTAREEVLNVINNLTFRQGTFTSLGLRMAMNTIRNLNFSEKQVMLITDGLPFEGDISYDDIEIEGAQKDRDFSKAYVQTMRGYGIYTSVLQVGGGNDNDLTWMKDLAASGGGEYFRAKTEEELNDIGFLDDLVGDSTGDVIKANSIIKVTRPRDEVLTVEKPNENGEPVKITINPAEGYVSEYVLSKSKSGANNVLSVDYNGGKGLKISVPLYSYWTYGNGKVASYTGKLGEIKKIGGGGALYDYNTEFFANIFSMSLPDEKSDYPFTLIKTIVGKRARIELNPARLQAGAVAQINVTTPANENITDIFVFDSTTYFYEFLTPQIGEYSIEITYSYGGKSYTANTGFILSYEPEYDAFEVFDASVLYKMLDGKGTVSEDGKLKIENDESEIATYRVKLTVPLLIIAAVMYVADIIIRKLKWNDIVSLFGRSGKRGKK